MLVILEYFTLSQFSRNKPLEQVGVGDFDKAYAGLVDVAPVVILLDRVQKMYKVIKNGRLSGLSGRIGSFEELPREIDDYTEAAG